MLIATIKKELLLITRDIQALAVLFLMPLAFILIMSFAMQNTYQQHSSNTLKGIYSADTSLKADIFEQHLSRYLSKSTFITLTDSKLKTTQEIQQRILQSELDFAIQLTQQAASDDADPTYTVKLFLSPNTSPQSVLLLQANIKEALGKTRLHTLLQQINNGSDASTESNIDNIANKDDIQTHYVYLTNENSNTPSSVQQSVPAWLVFAMFFVLIPMSSAMIAEIQFGTLQRLRSMRVPASQFLLGKIIPFLIINQIQFIIMMATGKLLIPLLGGDSLLINGSAAGLFLMSLSCSVAAVGFALLIAVASKTYEQANALGGTFNIILAAIGGIMVPKFIMPPSMQTLSQISPMSWALDGFLEVILQGGGVSNVLIYACSLIIFGMMAFFIAILIFNKRTLYND